MKKVVFTLKEDVCLKNGKDVNASELFNVLNRYGVVEPYEAVEAKIRQEYQAINTNLTAQLEAIKDQNLTQDEINIVKAYRDNKNAVVATHIAEKEQYASQLQAIKAEAEQRIAKIKALCD